MEQQARQILETFNKELATEQDWIDLDWAYSVTGDSDALELLKEHYDN